MYSDLYIQSKPRSFRGMIFVAVIIITAFVMYILTNNSTPIRASKKSLLEHKVVNISPKQFGVFWHVEEEDNGWVIYGKNPNDISKIALDSRGSDKEVKYKYHYVLLSNLESETTYYYKIISNNEIVISENKDVFTFKTPSSTDISSNLSPIYGKTVFPNDQPAVNAFAMLVFDRTYSLIAVSGSTGEWLIPIQYLFDISTGKTMQISEKDPITIRVFDDESRSLVRSTIGRSRPLPQPIVLGNNYSFISGPDVLSAQNNINTKSIVDEREIEIRYPKHNALISGNSPLIKGYGMPNKYISIKINSVPTFFTKIKIDDSGEWQVPENVVLPAGTYILEAKTTDQNNKLITMQRRFTIIKSGEQVLGEGTYSTPSATLNPQPKATLTITNSPSKSASNYPSPTPTEVANQYNLTPTPEPPVSGLNVTPYIVAGFILLLFGFGIVLAQ